MRKIFAALLCASLLALGLSAPANSQNAIRICVGLIGPEGQINCVDGWLPKLLNGLTNSPTAVKINDEALLGTIYCYNPNSSVAYIQLFDVATAAGVTLGTTVPNLSMGIPPTTASGTGPTDVGIMFHAGLQAAVTTTATGSTAPSAAMNCTITYN